MHTTSISEVRLGLLLAIATLLFGITMGIAFGVNEDGIKAGIDAGIAAHPTLHDAGSAGKIWRYAQRAHFHATGIGAFTTGLIVLTALLGLRPALKRLTAVFIGLGGSYPLGWFSMYLLSPSMGREAAHEAGITMFFIYLGTGGLLLGLAIIAAHLLTGFGGARGETPA